MSIEWGQWEKNDQGDIIYDIRKDKHRQIGLATIKIYETLNLKADNESDNISHQLKILAEEMRLFVIDNMTRSFARFLNAYTFLRASSDNLNPQTNQLVHLCNYIVNAKKIGADYTGELFNELENLGLYSIENSIDLQYKLTGIQPEA